MNPEEIDAIYTQVINEVCENPLYRFAELVAAHEREACAMLCDALGNNADSNHNYALGAYECTMAILERGVK